MSTTRSDPSPGAPQVQQALDRAIRSTAFSSSPKLCSFLTYIVEEELAGRGKAIKGKSIATDVYLRQLDEAGSAQNLVRVEARRLRRVLEEYYTEEGQSDPVRIRLAPGNYRPTLIWPQKATPRQKRLRLLLNQKRQAGRRPRSGAFRQSR